MGVNVFASYSHHDEGLWNELQKHLAVLRREDLISCWHDRRITAGRDWNAEIDTNLRESQVVLLLVSADFVNSDYCWDVELKEALEMHQRGTARVIPIILRHCEWQHTPFGKLLAVPTDGKPVTDFRPRDKALLQIAKAIRTVANELTLRQTS